MNATYTFLYFVKNMATWLPIACIVAVFGYICAYQFGLGPIPYFIGSGKRHYRHNWLIY